jgi:hypothetical protein
MARLVDQDCQRAADPDIPVRGIPTSPTVLDVDAASPRGIDCRVAYAAGRIPLTNLRGQHAGKKSGGVLGPIRLRGREQGLPAAGRFHVEAHRNRLPLAERSISSLQESEDHFSGS